MTVLKFDAATLAKVKAGDEPVYLGDESGTPVLRVDVSAAVPDHRREPTEEELDAAEADPVDYSLDEAREKIRRGAKL